MDTHRVLSWLIVSYSAIAALVLSLSLSEWPTNWTALEIFYLPMLWLCVQQPQRGLWFAISVVVLLDIVLLVFVHDLALLQQGLIKTGLFMLMAGLVSSAVEYHRHRCNVLQRESALLQRQFDEHATDGRSDGGSPSADGAGIVRCPGALDSADG